MTKEHIPVSKEEEIARPLGRPLLQPEGLQTWEEVISLFRRHGLDAPPVRLRDELVGFIAWARYGERLHDSLAALSPGRSKAASPVSATEPAKPLCAERAAGAANYAAPNDAAWVLWYGGPMPVNGDAMVWVRFRDGSPYYDGSLEGRQPTQAKGWDGPSRASSNWHHSDSDGDIIAYQLAVLNNPPDMTKEHSPVSREEEIARIVDPDAFPDGPRDGSFAAYEAQRRAQAFIKAKAILAALSPVDGLGSGAVGRRASAIIYALIGLLKAAEFEMFEGLYPDLHNVLAALSEATTDTGDRGRLGAEERLHVEADAECDLGDELFADAYDDKADAPSVTLGDFRALLAALQPPAREPG